MDRWDKCAFAVNEEDLLGRVCYGGLDLSSSIDITAFVLVFPPVDEDDKYIILPYFRFTGRKPRVAGSTVTMFPMMSGKSKDTSKTTKAMSSITVSLRSSLKNLASKFNIREIAFDRWGAVQNGAKP